MNRVAPFCVAVGVVLTPMGPAASARLPQISTITAIRNLEVSHAGGVTTVTLTADGALPDVNPRRLDDPPRIYIDFPGVLPGTRTVSTNDPTVYRVRIALHSSEPRVTRVVADLRRAEPFRIERDDHDVRRLHLILGVSTPGSPSLPLTRGVDPVAAAHLPEPVRPPVPPATRAGRARNVARDVEAYKKQVEAPVGRLWTLRSLLASIDSQTSQPPERLQLAVEEFDNIRRLLLSVRAPEALRPTHDALTSSCVFGALAASLQLEGARSGDASVLRNAVSAAAGALLLLDRACLAEIGCTGEPRSV